jgi:addiction module HigA family antidote
MAKDSKLLHPIHPGEILREDFMRPLGVSINRLARELMVPPGRISAIAAGKRAISADTALRLARFFGTPPQFWLNLQSEYELRLAVRASGREVDARIRPLAG